MCATRPRVTDALRQRDLGEIDLEPSAYQDALAFGQTSCPQQFRYGYATSRGGRERERLVLYCVGRHSACLTLPGIAKGDESPRPVQPISLTAIAVDNPDVKRVTGEGFGPESTRARRAVGQSA